MNVFGAVLAAGSSSRLGRPKQLVEHPSRRPLVRVAAEALLEAGCARVAVVVGAFREAVVASLAGLAVESVDALDFAEGMAASVRAATAWAEHGHASALLLAVCDQPHLDAAHLRALLRASHAGTRLAASSYADRLGVPALLPRRHFAALRSLHGDRGASVLLRQANDVAAVPWPAGLVDIDTPADLAALEAAPRAESRAPRV